MNMRFFLCCTLPFIIFLAVLLWTLWILRSPGGWRRLTKSGAFPDTPDDREIQILLHPEDFEEDD